jgi:hypothetical protein
VEIPRAETGEVEEFPMKRRQKMKNLKIFTAVAVIVATAIIVTAPSAWAQPAPVDRTHTAAVAETKPVTWDN